jgi:diguanylate cyclase (GGDEF)-like protein
LSIPIAGLRGTVGVLTLYRADADAFAQDHLRILSGISSKIGHSLENALQYEALEASATTDYLTGLNNARALFEQLNNHLARCERQQSPLTVIVCDLDRFKEVNDRYGHNAGNSVLQAFAKGLTGISREYDVAARFGGDEFVLVLPGMTAEAASDKIFALSSLAAEVGLSVCGEEILAASVGCASWPDDGVTADALLGAADERMYAHKGSRRHKGIRNLQSKLSALATEEEAIPV